MLCARLSRPTRLGASALVGHMSADGTQTTVQAALDGMDTTVAALDVRVDNAETSITGLTAAIGARTQCIVSLASQVSNATGNGEEYLVKWDTEDYDPAGMYSAATGKFTALTAGPHWLHYSLTFAPINGRTWDDSISVKHYDSSNALLATYTRKTGLNYAWHQATDTATVESTRRVSMAAGDYLTVSAVVSGGTEVTKLDLATASYADFGRG